MAAAIGPPAWARSASHAKATSHQRAAIRRMCSSHRGSAREHLGARQREQDGGGIGESSRHGLQSRESRPFVPTGKNRDGNQRHRHVGRQPDEDDDDQACEQQRSHDARAQGSVHRLTCVSVKPNRRCRLA